LLDINNIYIAAQNHGFDGDAFLQGIPQGVVQEFHLAGHSRIELDGREILIDSHASPVCDDVWNLYRAAVRRFGDVPTVIEWDTDIPALDVLRAEAAKADSIRTAAHALAA